MKFLKTKNTILNIFISFIWLLITFKLFNINNNSIGIILGTCLLTYLINKYKNNSINKKEKRISIIYSLLISLVFTIQSKITYSGNVFGSINENTFDDFCITDIFKIFFIFLIIYLIVSNIIILFKEKNLKIIDNKEKKKISNLKFWLLASLFIAIPYLIFLFTYYPGFVTSDSLASIYQSVGWVPLSNHHPALYTLFVAFFIRLGNKLISYNFGVFLYSLVQLLIVSGVLGYFLLWLRKHNVRKEYIILTYLFFAFNTIFMCYAITMWKDPMFSLALLLISLHLFDIVNSNGKLLKNNKSILIFIIFVFAIAFLRNNGIYIIIGLFLILLLKYKKELLKFHLSFLIAIVAILVIQGPVYNALNIKSGTEESFGIPLQQVARTISENGNINGKQKEFLNELFPYEKWKENYTPMSVDSIKWNSEFNKNYLKENKVEFLKVWFELLPGNFNKYIKSYLLSTYGFWSIGTNNEYGMYSQGITKTENVFEIEREDIIKKYTGVSLEDIFMKPNFIGAGTLLWLMILSGVLIISINKSKYLIVLAPSLLLVLTIFIATPVAFSLRYVFILPYALPLYVAIPFMIRNKQD